MPKFPAPFGRRRRVLVTGGSGLLGSHLLPLLLEDSEIFLLGRSAPTELAGEVHWIEADLARPISRDCLPAQLDAVIYLAQSARFREFPEAADDIFEVNTARLLALLDHARRAGARNFVYASTGGVYGSGREALREEQPPARSLDFYPACKLAGELFAEAYGKMMSVAILRYFFIYGAGQKREMLMPRLVDNVRAGRPVTLQGDGLRINPVHASDAAKATAVAARLDSSALINVAGPEIWSIREICEQIGRKVGRPPVFTIDERPSSGDMVADISTMKALLGQPRTGLDEGLADLL